MFHPMREGVTAPRPRIQWEEVAGAWLGVGVTAPALVTGIDYIDEAPDCIGYFIPPCEL